MPTRTKAIQKEPMEGGFAEGTKIVAMCVGAAVLYGILHDQVTARVCVEYFTIGHPPVFGTQSPTLLAFGWGVIATWWMGLIVGVPIALASQLRSWPKYNAAQLVRPISKLLSIMAIASLAAGITGYFAARSGGVWLLEPMRSAVPVSKHSAFLADLWAHLAAYVVGFIGGIVLCVRIYQERRRLA